jgi:uncharacterized membrane protein YbhN (UPF0104 family)
LSSRFLYALRWRFICTYGLELGNISNLLLLRINLLGEFVGIVMPSVLSGDAVRLLKLSTRTGKTAQATASIVADRIVGLLSMGLMTLVLLPVLNAAVGKQLHLQAGNLLSLLALGIVGLGGVLFWLRLRGRKTRLLSAMQQLNLSFFLLLNLMLLSVCGHLFFVSSYYIIFQELQPTPFLTTIAITLVAQLVRSVPISLLGFGPSEASLVALATLAGITPKSALVVVIIALGARYIFAICGLLIEFLMDGKTFFSALVRDKKQFHKD